MRTLILVVVLTAGTFAQSPALTLAAARERYVSADYRGALELLDRLADDESSEQDRQSIDLYRAFCLIALDRMEEADQTIGAMIASDPLYRPAAADVPPRVRSMFSEKRRAVLPAFIRARYERAKAAFDRGDQQVAADGFTQVLIALSDPDISHEASRSPRADVRVRRWVSRTSPSAH